MACEACGFIGTLFKDHCHVSGKNRGALCNSCNVIISNYDDDPSSLRAKAIELRGISVSLEGDTLYFHVQRALLEHKRARANIMDALAEYLERHM
jgi:hypothetical protein